MSQERAKIAYSGWHKFAAEAQPAPAAAQLDLVSEIERLKAELAEAKVPKKGKAKLEVVE